MSAKTTSFYRFWMIVAIFLISLIAAACGGRSSGSSSSDLAAAATPTMPAIPTQNFVAVGQLTVVTDTNTVTGTTATTQTTNAGSDANLKRGETAYTKNKCGDCHGAQGEGVTDKGGPVAGTTISFEDFDKALRTGSGLGNTHIFGRSAVSPSGMEALYAYVQSLPVK